MVKIEYPEIKVVLKEPINGYWDGGKKQYFTFIPTFFKTNSNMEEYSKKFKPHDVIRWGSYDANFFFSSRSGISWKDAIRIAKGKILKLYKGKSEIKEININWEIQNID